jgi:hypothetical protein
MKSVAVKALVARLESAEKICRRRKNTPNPGQNRVTMCSGVTIEPLSRQLAQGIFGCAFGKFSSPHIAPNCKTLTLF